ncbi:MAG: hypothetical protein LQ350_000582 [Teloschistes chrysophthalmus]|nr:MAG: hypothetical protein LQ350_000582 [Niorma chrysophthalma]
MESPPVSAAFCDETRGPLMLGFGWTAIALGIVIVALRFYFRSGLRKGIAWDDYFILFALLIGIAGVSFLTKLVEAGGGRHIVCLPPGQIYLVLKWSTIAQVCNVIGIGFVKVSVCLCVLRIIDRTRRRLAQFLWLLIAVVAASHLAQVLIFLLQCRPIQTMWDPTVKGTCFSARVTYTAGYTNYGMDAVTDLICAGVPVFVIHRLHMNIRNKLAICFLMSLGVLTAGCAIAKAATLGGLFDKDYTWGIVNPGILTIFEHYGGIIIASMPALKPLFSKVLDSAGPTPKDSTKRILHNFEPRCAGLPLSQSYDTIEGGYVQAGSRPDSTLKFPETRFSSRLEFEVSRDYKLSDLEGGRESATLPDNPWTRIPGTDRWAGPDPVHIRGYQHIDDPSA